MDIIDSARQRPFPYYPGIALVPKSMSAYTMNWVRGVPSGFGASGTIWVKLKTEPSRGHCAAVAGSLDSSL